MKVVFNKRMRFGRLALLVGLAGAVGLGCKASAPASPQDGGTGQAAEWAARLQTFQLSVAASSVDPTFTVRDHFIAAVEMQLAGEPLAQTMGRNLADYSRDHLPTDIYFDPTIPGNSGRVDIVGFATAVESYEYSKQPLNNVGLESGAGLAALFGPVSNPGGATGADALAGMRKLVQSFGALSNGTSRFIHDAVTVPPTNAPNNPLGWPGLWPIMMPFSSFDPHISPTNSVAEGCSITSDDDPGATGAIGSNDYECDYTGLHLPNRSAQTSGTVDPGSTGWHAWKAALWVLNYLQVMHDSQENPINTVDADQLPLVGTPGNSITGNAGPGNPSVPGVYLGSSDIEGFQAAMFIQMIQDQAEEWLMRLSTTDGSTLSGFSSLMDATSYSTTSPLRWFPGSVRVTESDDASGFPRPTGFRIASPDSQLLDLAGMLGAYSSLYALTDTNNSGAGGSQPARAYFRGFPFLGDDQLANGQSTPHDRMLAVMRVLVVNMERMHRDPSTGLPVDTVSMAGGRVARGSTLSADVAAYTLLALRTARRAVDSELVLYSNTTPDAEGAPCLMDSLPSVAGRPFSGELNSLIGSLATAFYDVLTDASGKAYLGWNIQTGEPTDDGTTLDAYTAGIRGLLIAFLTTGDVKYRDRAELVYQQLESQFYFAPGRVYLATPFAPGGGAAPSSVTFTPRRFALLEGALRDMYELVGVNTGNAALGSQLQDRMGRLIKLVLDGWDDRDQDEEVEWPDECVRYDTNYTGPGSEFSIAAGGQANTLVHGGLQMAERTLTGEVGSFLDVPMPGVPRVITTDRQSNCVPEVSAVGLPAALANSITFTLSPYAQ
jgi:hypothetical protein